MKNINCFWYHIWSKWSIYETYAITDFGGEQIGKMIVQKRECQHCNLTEYNKKRFYAWS